MKWVKVLSVWFFAAIMLVAVNSCGVPDPIEPTATAVPADGSTINNSDSIVITFSASMTSGSLTLSGNMATESDSAVWSNTSQTNDTLTINPGVASGGVWTAGSHTLIVDVVATNSGVPLSTLTLNYTVDAVVPTAVVVPANTATIIGSDLIVILFSVAMEPSTLVLTGDMAAESNGGTWSTTSNTNDTLVIRPNSAWTGSTSTLIVDVDSTAGASLSTLTLTYSVDTSVPTAIALPADKAAINSMTPIVISFISASAMEPATLVLNGSLAGESDSGVWSSNSNPNDTLTVSPSGAWPGGVHTLIIDVDASNGIPLSTLLLNYTVDVALPTASVTPVTGSSITGGESIVIEFTKSMDIATLTVSGSLWDNANTNPNDLWSTTTTNPNEKLTISPASSWPVGDINFTLDIVDLVGNSLTIPTHNYTVDITTPVITLTGDAAVSIELGTAYIDAGATALDNIDGVITGSIVTVNPVDVNTVGVYVITYNVSDAAGNPAIQVTRTVTVADVTVPVITLTGAATISIELGTAYTDEGATAEDNTDGDITGSIVTVNPVDVNTVGTYTVTYDVDDAAGNPAAQVTRTVNVTADVTVPVITLAGSDPENIELGSAYVDAGATALDNTDGVITGSIVTVNPVDVNTVGTYTVTYDVDDAAGNSGVQVARTVNVTADATIPVITLVGSDPVSIERGTPYVDVGATALDNIDGVITGSIVTVNPVDVNTVGTYVITYDVSDTAGNLAIQVTRTVNVTADATIPVITLVGSDPVNIELGSSYVDAGATALDNTDGVITGSIVTVNPVDVNTVGTYTVTYDVDDAAGNSAVQVTRAVNVTADVTVPVITLTGAAEISIELGTAYTDAGATAEDNTDGDITGSIVTVNPVDVNIVGTYTVTYDVDDAAGNSAVQVTRTVNVTADATVPVITLVGSDPVNIVQGASYVDAGATALDNIDGVITGSIVTVNPVDVNTVGTYTVTYDVDDAAGNPAVQVTRTVNVTI